MSTRREFLKGVGLATAGLSMNPASVFAMTSGETKQAKSEKVKIAYIGIGNRGQQNIDEFAKTNIIHKNKASNLKSKLAAHINKLA